MSPLGLLDRPVSAVQHGSLQWLREGDTDVFAFCSEPPLAEMEAGICTTGTLLSVPEAAFPELV
jgi:hypothetical protein